MASLIQYPVAVASNAYQNFPSIRSNVEIYKIEKDWAVKRFVESINPGEHVLAIVQTLRRGRMRDNGTLQIINDSEVKKLALAVRKIIGRRFYGSSYRRYERMPPMCWGYEGQNEDVRDHLNLAIAVPEWMSVVVAMSIIESAFDSMYWSSGFLRTIDIA